MVALDEALRWSLCWSSREAAGQRAAGWRGRAGAAGKLWGRARVRVRRSVRVRVRVVRVVRVRVRVRGQGQGKGQGQG